MYIEQAQNNMANLSHAHAVKRFVACVLAGLYKWSGIEHILTNYCNLMRIRHTDFRFSPINSPFFGSNNLNVCLTIHFQHPYAIACHGKSNYVAKMNIGFQRNAILFNFVA